MTWYTAVALSLFAVAFLSIAAAVVLDWADRRTRREVEKALSGFTAHVASAGIPDLTRLADEIRGHMLNDVDLSLWEMELDA